VAPASVGRRERRELRGRRWVKASEEGMDETRARHEIARAFPELAPREVAFLGAGVDSDAFLVDGAWVFRFPKRPDVARALAREVALLPRLADRLPVAIPRFEYVAEQAGNGLLFAGYRVIEGEPLTPELFEALGPADRTNLLATLAGVLEAVHAFPLAEARAAGVEDLSTRAWVASAWSRGRGPALARLSAPDGGRLAELIDGFLADPANFDAPAALLYADFAPEHLLFDPVERRLAGLIDWGDLAIGDPDYDLTFLRQDFGEGFVADLLEHLPHPDPARLFRKLRVFDACDHLIDLAAAAEEASDDEEPAETLAALREIAAEA
jgi:aminoglycoside 2''-phosphotransferase